MFKKQTKKPGSLKRVSKTGKTTVRLNKAVEKKKTQMSGIKNGRVGVSTDIEEIIREIL